MKTSEIRQRFLQHFQNNGHTFVPSASLIVDDPNLLFVTAGMVPFAPFYLGQQTPPYKRATSVQKCIRTNDIDEVGKTTRHGTFFQMNGNFSFGDYFKEGAMRLAWDLITRSQSDGGYGFDESKLWVSIYLDDDEADDLWRNKIGVSPDRIVRLGMADNYWSMGIPGPCGPDSEIFIDRGPEYGPDGDPGSDPTGDRYLEFWNLVFMQNLRGEGTGKDNFEILGELPQKNIDTGMGLERVAYLLQGVDNLYEIDEVYPVIDRAAQLTGKRYGANHADDVRFRIVGDHVRAALMLISDGVTPSNEAQGYVLRRIIRRAIRAIRLLGVQEPVLPELLPVSRDCMKASYPEVETDYRRISDYAYAEEDTFLRTLQTGTTILDTAVSRTRDAGSTTLSGERAFVLHDTYGFPIELTLEMAAEQGVSVDENEFRRLMREQQERGRGIAKERKTGAADLSVYRGLLDTNGPSEFTGYSEVGGQGRVLALLRGVESVPVASAGDEIDVVLDETPFYAESGGQQADHGRLSVDGGELTVTDVQKPLPGLIRHSARVTSGEIRVGDTVRAQVDVDRRRAVSRAHTATHLVHRAVRGALGESAHQAGSLNAPGRMRFDFTTPGSVAAGVMADVEAEVNASLAQDLDVQAYITNLDEARKLGAMALFGEKYGNEVRVVDIGDGYSLELCAGTHVLRSTQLGMVKLVADSSIGAGVHRVEALVGQDAFDYLSAEHLLVAQLANTLKSRPEEVPDRVGSLLDRLRVAEKELAGLRSQAALSSAGELAGSGRALGDVTFVGAAVGAAVSAGDLRSLATEVRGRLGSTRPAVVVLLATDEGKVSFVAATNDRARDRGIAAGEVVRALAPAVSGRGGGKPDLAQGGGTDPAGVPDAITAAAAFVQQRGAGSA
ncbi:MAG TPA: alanine--tRNA ligase [Mycobacteriales bacterium]|jgi:alanyl-tRNA synthetase|nr:alanine--tRNA ligase [Mycobacteriales bacterium]